MGGQNWTFLSAEGYESLANPGNPYGQSATPHTPHIVQMGMTYKDVILTPPCKNMHTPHTPHTRNTNLDIFRCLGV